MPFDPADLDLVVTLYDPSQQRLARALHPWPWVTNAPTLFTALPATGTYYIAVENCLAILSTECRATTPIVNLGYTIRVSDISGPTLIREGNEPANDDAAGAPALAYTKAGGSSYVPLLLFGVFQSASDRDTYTFTVPADVPVAPGTRARANFWIQPGGRSGNGSTASSGPVYVIDAADTSGAHLADLDSFQFGSEISSNSQPASLSFPVTPGKAYRFVFTHTSSLQPDSNGFYFVQHQVGAGADAPLVEMEQNDTLAMAGSLPALSNPDGTYAFTVDGDLTTAATDIDFFHLALPSGVTTVSGACLSRLLGSGVGSLSYGLVDSSGTLLRVQTEVGNAFHKISQTVPAGGLTLKISATIQIAGITGNSYTCRFVASP